MCHITRMPNLSLERFGLCVRNFCLGADMHSRTSVLVHTQISYKPKSDCIYHAPIDLKPSIGVRLVQNQLENGKFNLISKIFFYVGLCAREFFGQCPGRRGERGFVLARGEAISSSGRRRFFSSDVSERLRPLGAYWRPPSLKSANDSRGSLGGSCPTPVSHKMSEES